MIEYLNSKAEYEFRVPAIRARITVKVNDRVSSKPDLYVAVNAE